MLFFLFLFCLSIGSQNEDSQNMTNSERDLIRSNPDLKTSGCILIGPHQQQSHHSPPNGGSYHHPHLLNTSITNVNQTTPHNTSKNTDTTTLSNLSNNLSLNLSIHTAEEFGMEMLEWLNSEAAVKHSHHHHHHLNLIHHHNHHQDAVAATTAANGKLVTNPATNATLV